MDGERAGVRVASTTFRVLLLGKRQFQSKPGPQPRAVALDIEFSAEFFCRQRAAVQSEPVPAFSSGESLFENFGQVLRRDPDTVIRH